MLFIEIADHRIRTQQELDNLSDEAIGWKITWAMKSIIERETKQKVKDYDINAKLGLGIVESEPAVFDLDDNEISLDDILKQLDNLKFRGKTKQFVLSVLEHGKEQTISDMGLTTKQFGRKIAEVEKHCREIGVRAKSEVVAWEHELGLLYQVIDCIECEDYQDSDMAEVIWDNAEFWDDYIGNIKGIKNPVMLVEDWQLGYRKDQYKFVNKVYQDRDVLSGKISKVLEGVK